VRERAHWVSRATAGRGAVREFAEFVLQSQQRLDAALARYAGDAT
jgi:3-deoxy-D-manno-octulosonate 8-phosphate phosphatase KdsC-like HAD superfamily phosphatase